MGRGGLAQNDYAVCLIDNKINYRQKFHLILTINCTNSIQTNVYY